MNDQEQEQLQHDLRVAAELLFKDRPQEQLQDFDSIEMSIREHLLERIGPNIASFFCRISRNDGRKNQKCKNPCRSIRNMN